MHCFLYTPSHKNMHFLILETLFSIKRWDLFSTSTLIIFYLHLSYFTKFYIKTCAEPKVHRWCRSFHLLLIAIYRCQLLRLDRRTDQASLFMPATCMNAVSGFGKSSGWSTRLTSDSMKRRAQKFVQSKNLNPLIGVSIRVSVRFFAETEPNP